MLEQSIQTTTINRYFAKVFGLMALGVATSTLLGFAFIAFEPLSKILFAIYTIPFGIVLLFLGQLGLTLWLRNSVVRQNPTLSMILFFIYAATLSVTFATVFIAFDLTVIMQAFVGATVLFVCLAIIGYTTNVDITKFKTLLFVGLISVIVLTLLNVFIFRNSFFDLLLSYAGLILFLGLTAYDMQKLKQMYYQVSDNKVAENSIVVWGAFDLFLDFVNIFFYLLRILGRSRD